MLPKRCFTPGLSPVMFSSTIQAIMRRPIILLTALSALAIMMAGCAKPQKKFSRGLRNVTEPVRLGEIGYSVEQQALFGSSGTAYSAGLVNGLNKTLVRTGVGAYEILSFPFPPYDPVLTWYIAPEPAHPDSRGPGMLAEPTLAPDAYLGFSGGYVLPVVPGSQFFVFDP